MPLWNMEEIEVKFLNIDPVDLEVKLNSLGAKKIFDRVYRRRLFDYPDLKLNAKGAYLRLRDEGDKITLCFKQRLGIGQNGENDKGLEEIEVIVSDFENTAQIFLSVGFIEKFYEENRRVRFELSGVEFDIDYWPLINPYLEIEAKSWEEVDKAINLIGLNKADQKIFTANQVYKLANIQELDYKILTFEKQIKR